MNTNLCLEQDNSAFATELSMQLYDQLPAHVKRWVQDAPIRVCVCCMFLEKDIGGRNWDQITEKFEQLIAEELK